MKIYLMHQTHTDIGYTDRQEKIALYHVDYLKQAIRISEAIAAGKKEWEGFIWNNENHWIIENFLAHTDSTWEDRLIKAVKRDHIQLACNYLNMTDLVDFDLLKHYLNKAKAFGEKHDVRVDAAVSMDINGWTFGYAQAMYDAGIRHFYTCIHNHHGFVPFEHKHYPFLWETPNNDKLLVWHGDVYNQGNVARLVPDVIGNLNGNILETTPIITDEQLAYAKKWIDDYIASVKAQDYPYDFLPMVTKGLLVDNAPPNPHIIESIRAFNEKYGEDVTIEMVGINDFFDIINAKKLSLNTHRGDWTDWWSDGFASTPKSLVSYREAQRNYHKLSNLNHHGADIDDTMLESLRYNLMMYAEHTWGYFTSVSEPWNKMTTKLESRNEMFAYKANELADMLLDRYQLSQGELAKCVGRPMHYKITNPYPIKRKELVKLHINWWEEFLIKNGYMVTEKGSDTSLPYQEIRVDEASRRQINVYVTLQPFESKILTVIPDQTYKREMPMDPLFTRDTTYDYVSPFLDNRLNATQFFMESPFFKLEFEQGRGIARFLDKTTNTDLIREDAETPLFTPVYETSEIEHTYLFAPKAMKAVRASYGRNRKLISSLRDKGELINVKVITNGPLIARVQLKYRLKGTSYTVIELSLYRDEPRLDVSLIMGKDTVWAPESIYVALPLTTQSKETLWIDKSGAPIRPRVDQLPGTLTTFYTTQTGYVLHGETTSIQVSMPDVPIVHLGTLNPGIVKVHGNPSLSNTDLQYAWVMNNYWETNFATNLGGFHRFDFQINVAPQASSEDALETMRDLQRTNLVYQVGGDV